MKKRMIGIALCFLLSACAASDQVPAQLSAAPAMEPEFGYAESAFQPPDETLEAEGASAEERQTVELQPAAEEDGDEALMLRAEGIVRGVNMFFDR